MKKIILLDIDSVLIEPLGYRKAVVAVWEYITELMQIPSIPITERMMAEMEANGITSEWDMLPILIASLWQHILSRTNSIALPADGEVFSAARAFAKIPALTSLPEIQVPRIQLVPNQFPAETAWESGLFPAIPKPLGDRLLRNSRDPYLSAITRLFQQYVLGTEKFRQTYQLPADVESPSFLALYDKPIIPNPIRRELLSAQQKGELHIAVITSRPSLPPRRSEISPVGYAPEAEIALESLEMANLMLIGFGKLKYFGDLYHIKPDELVKPAAVHSLAAILALLMGDEKSAIDAAINWVLKESTQPLLDWFPPQLEIHLVEDTLSGVRSLWSAGQLLRDSGRDVRLFAYGLTGGNLSKQSAFAKANIPHFPDWDSLWQTLANKLMT